RVDQGHVRRHVPCPIARVAAAPVADQRLEFGNQDDEGGLGHGEWNESVTLLPQPTVADSSWGQSSKELTRRPRREPRSIRGSRGRRTSSSRLCGTRPPNSSSSITIVARRARAF